MCIPLACNCGHAIVYGIHAFQLVRSKEVVFSKFDRCSKCRVRKHTVSLLCLKLFSRCSTRQELKCYYFIKSSDITCDLGKFMRWFSYEGSRLDWCSKCPMPKRVVLQFGREQFENRVSLISLVLKLLNKCSTR